MGYHYDPILCMNVPDSTSKAKDASWKAWTLYIDGKWVKSFNSSMAPIKEAQKFMKENYPGKVGKLTRNTGSSSGYSISGSEHKDSVPAEMRDANKYVEAASKMLKEGKSGTEIVFALQRMGLTPVDAAHYYGEAKLSSPRAYDSLDKAIDENYIVSGMKSQLGQMLKRYKDPKNRNKLVSQYIGIVNNHRANGKVTEEEFNEFVKYAKGLVGGSHDALSKAIRTADAENERWITMNGSHVKIDGEGNAVAGNEKVKSIINSKKKSETAGKSEKKQAEGSKKETYKSYSDFKKNSGAEDLLQFVDEVAFDAGHDEKDPDKEDLKRIGKEFQDVYEKIKDHPNVGEYVNKMRREINDKIEDEIGTTLYDYSYLRIKELNDTLKIFNKYYD